MEWNPFGYQPWREKRTFQAMFDILEADIVVMQEIKIQRKDLHDDMVLVPGWDVFFSFPKYKKGYSGVAIYTRTSKCTPIRAEEGITGVLTPPKSTTKFRNLPLHQQIGGYPRPGQLDGIIDEATLDSEGRCVILEFPGFVLFGVYSPANRDESRDDFRSDFFQALDVRIRNLVAEGKEVILTGDLNVVRSEMDSTNVAEMLRKEDMSLDDWLNMPVRRIFNQLIFEGKVVGERDQEPVLWDLCRCFHPERAGMNTCWDTKRNTRPANNGSRIDYVLCSDGIKQWFTFADIQEGLMGSDHCPVFATFANRATEVEGKERELLEVLNPSGMFRDGERRDWSSKDLLPLSGRLMPEFQRRSIREMFRQTAEATDSRSDESTKRSDETSTSLKRKTSSETSLETSTSRSKTTTSLKTTSSKTTNDKYKRQRTLQSFFKPESSGLTSQPKLNSKPTGSSTIEAESWSMLLGGRVVPRCEHNEPCISLVTKKPGVNCGRSFYICPRPLGPSGEKEKGSEWRCGTFIWSSDWR
ncbi:hypothetical protein LCI18_001666 [Fusarium solani-melongenae]|uniref:Uncharacterized protein n=1 Tax=Fusarium solani subsp. cucurbitae TaxID=2747967 RepID=A0ACD3YP50_FUSSC|nr:hypothetical protein LCI18_001666 [Fusarium solani-melongenae]